MTDFALILLFLNFGLFILSFIFIVMGVLKAKSKEGYVFKENELPKLAKLSYGLALLSMFLMIFISFLLIAP